MSGVCPAGAVVRATAEAGVGPSPGLHGVFDVKEQCRRTILKNRPRPLFSVITGFPGVVWRQCERRANFGSRMNLIYSAFIRDLRFSQAGAL